MPQISTIKIAVDGQFTDNLLKTIVGLANPKSCIDLGVRLRRLADDVDDIADGRGPNVKVLVQAPILSNWSIFAAPDGVRLMGTVKDHPHAGPGLILTSMIFAIDPTLQWVRTLSRFYRLGQSALPSEPADLQ